MVFKKKTGEQEKPDPKEAEQQPKEETYAELEKRLSELLKRKEKIGQEYERVKAEHERLASKKGDQQAVLTAFENLYSEHDGSADALVDKALKQKIDSGAHLEQNLQKLNALSAVLSKQGKGLNREIAAVEGKMAEMRKRREAKEGFELASKFVRSINETLAVMQELKSFAADVEFLNWTQLARELGYPGALEAWCSTRLNPSRLSELGIGLAIDSLMDLTGYGEILVKKDYANLLDVNLYAEPQTEYAQVRGPATPITRGSEITQIIK